MSGEFDWRVAMVDAKAAKEAADVAVSEVMAAQVAWNADVVVVYSTLMALNLAPREAEFAIAAAKVGDRVQVFRSARPTLNGVEAVGGVMVEPHATVFEAGKISIMHVIPAVGLNQTLRIPLKLVAYRPAS